VAHKISLMKRSALLVLLVSGVLSSAAWGQRETVLHSFCAQTGCADGQMPEAGLVFDQKGNLYGTTISGGIYNEECRILCGVVFKLTSEGEETALYSFCTQTNCADGALPVSGLVFDEKGTLYGTAYGGGNNNSSNCVFGCGVVFELTPERKYAVLYTFCAETDCTDGETPDAGLVVDQKGNLYGTTIGGGANGQGVVFRLTPEGKETVLYSFCAQTNCTDGGEPSAGLTFDQEGNLYGTTYYGGNSSECEYGGCGVVFKLTPEGKETVLYSFCAQTNCTDGGQPYAGLTFDQKGDLYGTASYGGVNGQGVVFRVTPEGEETVLYSFCTEANCHDGSDPHGGVVFDEKGNLYGATYSGGAPSNSGVVFKLTAEGKYAVLYSFCWNNNCTDGATPYAGVILDQKGNLYGTTFRGGAYGSGVVFKLTP
jgi:uncharacterized repeat protein (TIGR03803 family)